MKALEEYIVLTQKKLFNSLKSAHGKSVCASLKRGYILVKGEAPTLLVAHMDTVHKNPVKNICVTADGNILMSPQGIGGDDRCGVYALNAIYEKSTVKPWLLFTCDEEIGGVGAEKFCDDFVAGKLPESLKELKVIIEIDRKGNNDAVYYGCDNPDFEAYITKHGFATASGSFSDISLIAPELGVAAVNISSGYYGAHTLHEYINRQELEANIERVTTIVAETTSPDFPKYEYIEYVHRREEYDWLKELDYYYPSSLFNGWDNYRYDLDGVPKSIVNEYDALLDYYTREELEEFRKDRGDNFIIELCKTEFGDRYWKLFGKQDGEEQND